MGGCTRGRLLRGPGSPRPAPASTPPRACPSRRSATLSPPPPAVRRRPCPRSGEAAAKPRNKDVPMLRSVWQQHSQHRRNQTKRAHTETMRKQYRTVQNTKLRPAQTILSVSDCNNDDNGKDNDNDNDNSIPFQSPYHPYGGVGGGLIYP